MRFTSVVGVVLSLVGTTRAYGDEPPPVSAATSVDDDIAVAPSLNAMPMVQSGKLGFTPVIDVIAEYGLRIRRDDLGARDWYHEFELPRALVGATVHYERASASVITETVRSTSGGSLIGLAGDSIVMRVRNASVGYEFLRRLRLDAGVVPTLTIPALERVSGLRVLGGTGLERTGLGTPADLGVTSRVELPHGLGFVGVGAYNGQGYTGRELNRGKNVEVAAVVRPFAWGPSWVRPLAVHATFVGGSNGTSRARADRVTGGLSYARREGSGGVSVTYGVGVADDGGRRAVMVDAFLRAEPFLGLLVGAQAVHVRRDLDVSGDDVTTLTGAVGYRIVTPLEALLAVDHQRVGDAASATLPALDPWRVRAVIRFHPE
jgi:hypothetical protein